MKYLSAGLTLVNVAAVAALLLGIMAGGLGQWTAFLSIWIAIAATFLAFTTTRKTPAEVSPDGANQATRSGRRVWFWSLAFCFGFFAFRSFCWLIFLDGNQFKVESPNNLGDLALHLTYIRNLASGVPFWPDNPIYVFSHLRYPAGTDLFNSLLLLLGVDLTRGLIWAGLLGSLASFYALYRWGGVFGVAGFLFNGGLAGLQLFKTWEWLDYQGDKSIAWKSLPLSMLVTQRGLLYALPAGLLLLYQWRARYLQGAAFSKTPSQRGGGEAGVLENAAPCPLWVEVTLYASMPLFHLHTFMALSIVIACLFVVGGAALRKHFALVAGIALLPATALVWLITDHFEAQSLIKWFPGWVQGVDDFSKGFFRFWFENFGVLIPLVLLLVGTLVYRAWRAIRIDDKIAGADIRQESDSLTVELKRLGTLGTGIFRSTPAFAFLAPATLIFFFAFFVKTAPWGWDNIKLIIWAYLILLPFLWRELIARWPIEVRAAVCFALFSSGFISLTGGLLKEENGYGFADRAELDAVAFALRKVPVQARFLGFPTYNHPLLLQGRKMVLGYPGHLWTQGFDYAGVENKLNALMRGAPDWRQQARNLHARYLFWGREESAHYPDSTRPWEREAKSLEAGKWGAIYDLEAPTDPVLKR